jgi:hypothetical protein
MILYGKIGRGVGWTYALRERPTRLERAKARNKARSLQVHEAYLKRFCC